ITAHPLPKPISRAHSCLPKTQGSIFAATGVQFPIRRETHTVHWSKKPLCIHTHLFSSIIIKLVHLEVFSTTHKKVLRRMKRSCVHRCWCLYLLDLLKA
ncbi:hypothetical protein EGW08_014661, partial [Elysia chlorotica]